MPRIVKEGKDEGHVGMRYRRVMPEEDAPMFDLRVYHPNGSRIDRQYKSEAMRDRYQDRYRRDGFKTRKI